jgi:hypothetical protein
MGLSPMTAASWALGFISFMNAALGLRLPSVVAADSAFLAAGAFFAAAVLDAAFFAVAIWNLSINY